MLLKYTKVLLNHIVIFLQCCLGWLVSTVSEKLQKLRNRAARVVTKSSYVMIIQEFSMYLKCG